MVVQAPTPRHAHGVGVPLAEVVAHRMALLGERAKYDAAVRIVVGERGVGPVGALRSGAGSAHSAYRTGRCVPVDGSPTRLGTGRSARGADCHPDRVNCPSRWSFAPWVHLAWPHGTARPAPAPTTTAWPWP